MATKYRLQNLDGETLKTVSKKQTAIAEADKLGLQNFRVVTEKGTAVYEQVLDLPEEAPAEEAPAEEKEKAHYHVILHFPGHYSIVTAPGAVEIAEAAGVPAWFQNVQGSVTRKVYLGGDDAALADVVARYIEESVASARVELKAWQKENLERRRNLTDMQRYIEHRELIARHLSAAARKVKKNVAS